MNNETLYVTSQRIRTRGAFEHTLNMLTSHSLHTFLSNLKYYGVTSSNPVAFSCSRYPQNTFCFSSDDILIVFFFIDPHYHFKSGYNLNGPLLSSIQRGNQSTPSISSNTPSFSDFNTTFSSFTCTYYTLSPFLFFVVIVTFSSIIFKNYT